MWRVVDRANYLRVISALVHAGRRVRPSTPPARSRFALPPDEGQVDRVSAFHRASRIPLLAPMGKTPGFPVRHKSGRSRPHRLRLPRTPQVKDAT